MPPTIDRCDQFAAVSKDNQIFAWAGVIYVEKYYNLYAVERK